jgi:hypothetical protein
MKAKVREYSPPQKIATGRSSIMMKSTIFYDWKVSALNKFDSFLLTLCYVYEKKILWNLFSINMKSSFKN